jgi:hypothetical protein
LYEADGSYKGYLWKLRTFKPPTDSKRAIRYRPALVAMS